MQWRAPRLHFFDCAIRLQNASNRCAPAPPTRRYLLGVAAGVEAAGVLGLLSLEAEAALLSFEPPPESGLESDFDSDLEDDSEPDSELDELPSDELLFEA